MSRLVVALTSAAALTFGAAAPAYAATTDKATVLASFTETNAASYQRWNAARQNRDDWTAYALDWGTDYCSASPDRPLGYDFRLACWRHDFGYRNFKDIGAFGANKDRVDAALYADLKRKCATYRPAARPACYSLAWVYYQAVSVFGSFAAVDPDDVTAGAEAVG